jgi:hypothetical protein
MSPRAGRPFGKTRIPQGQPTAEHCDIGQSMWTNARFDNGRLRATTVYATAAKFNCIDVSTRLLDHHAKPFANLFRRSV